MIEVMMNVNEQQIVEFRDSIWKHYEKHGRQLPWREPEPDGNFDPYKILLSEIMLQQTQVKRVIPKYQQFLVAFPNIKALSRASLAEVLRLWNGLGYNRRAQYLLHTAQTVANNFREQFPQSEIELMKLPGIGHNTAGAILAYAFNQPSLFVETNVRTVYIHHFFSDANEVDDKEITALLKQTLDYKNPREFYWALMDYGSWLKVVVGNNINKSRHYKKQSTFIGSKRQIRGVVVRILASTPSAYHQLNSRIADQRLKSVLVDLQKENLITKNGGLFYLSST
jgi:A/G-specific adenine glycosylase